MVEQNRAVIGDDLGEERLSSGVADTLPSDILSMIFSCSREERGEPRPSLPRATGADQKKPSFFGL
ncbi:hypothetical protein [Mesorhizobium sp.]|uniref:hypothetical protein n=1 Tax=Mesorhizobium sp. TaxID=1871066 RepID=UPI0025BE626A|nr:hypothetical protein [Mesorhizobium sp.]